MLTKIADRVLNISHGRFAEVFRERVGDQLLRGVIELLFEQPQELGRRDHDQLVHAVVHPRSVESLGDFFGKQLVFMLGGRAFLAG